MKDHAGFLRAAGRVARAFPSAQFLLAGSGVAGNEPAPLPIIGDEGLSGRVLLLGEHSDTAQLNAALDIACSASAWGEGFSNSIGEAMACGIPCVVTDIGDSRCLIADTGLTVRASDPDAFAEAIARLVRAGAERRKQLGETARKRIESEFSLPSVVRRYESVYQKQVERTPK